MGAKVVRSLYEVGAPLTHAATASGYGPSLEGDLESVIECPLRARPRMSVL